MESDLVMGAAVIIAFAAGLYIGHSERKALYAELGAHKELNQKLMDLTRDFLGLREGRS